MARRILVTGAAGYLGSRIAEALSDTDAMVVLCARADADLTDGLAVRTLLERHAPTHVVHAAGRVFGSLNELTEANKAASENLGQATVETDPDILLTALGSSAEYGLPDNGAPITETKTCEPVSDYGRSKLAATRIFQDLAEQRGLKMNIIRPFNPIAAPLSPDQVLGAFVEKAAEARMEGSNTISMGPLGAVRDFLDADHLSQLVKALVEGNHEGQIVNACSGIPHRVGDLVEFLNGLEGGGFDIEEKPAESGATTIIGDPSKMFTYVPEALKPDIERILRRAWALRMN